MKVSKFGRKLAAQSGIGRPFYQTKAKRVLELVRKSFEGIDYHVHQPGGAFFVWMRFPNLPITNQQLYERLKQRGVVIVPGHHFFPGLPEPWPHVYECIRASYAQDDKIVVAGIQIIAKEVPRACE